MAGLSRHFQTALVQVPLSRAPDLPLVTLCELLGVPKELVAVFTWTIDAEYPHDTATYYFYFAETKVKLINVPATFDEKFRAWAFTKNAERERAAKSIRPTPVRFDLALANDAVHHSSEEWGKVCSMFADPCRFRFFQQLTIQLGGIVFCRYWPRMGCKLASSLMLLLAGPMIRLSPSKDVLNYVHDHTAHCRSTTLARVGADCSAKLSPYQEPPHHHAQQPPGFFG